MIGQVKVLKKNKTDAHKNAMYYLEKVGMAPYINAKPRQLSGGQKQRVAIARALALNPKILFFDEPTSVLTPQGVEGLFEAVRFLVKNGKTVLFITHKLKEVMEISDSITVFKKMAVTSAR
mgnify:CR=1 FL=1